MSELTQVVREAKAERGWGLVGPTRVEAQVRQELGKGRAIVSASFVEGEGEMPIPVPRPGEAGRSCSDSRRVEPFVRWISRRSRSGACPECEVASRPRRLAPACARVRRTERLVLADLGSTNGTLRTAITVREHLFEDGDRITIGRPCSSPERPTCRRSSCPSCKYALVALLYFFMYRAPLGRHDRMAAAVGPPR